MKASVVVSPIVIAGKLVRGDASIGFWGDVVDCDFRVITEEPVLAAVCGCLGRGGVVAWSVALECLPLPVGRA